MSEIDQNELVLSSQRVITPEGEKPATVRIQAGRITSIEDYQPNLSTDGPGEDLGNLAILPGLIDPHVHLNDPGNTEWEGFLTGTAAAAAGGITTLVDMPLNSLPVTTTLHALKHKRLSSERKLLIDVGFYAGLVPGNEKEIGELLGAGVLGVKAFLCHSGLDAFPNATEKELRHAMPLLAKKGAVLLAHAELVKPQPAMANHRSYADYLASRPPGFEQEAIKLLINLCRETGCRTHIVHLADAESLPMLRAARQEGLPITVETCPHYLYFSAEEIPDGATQYKCAPPIRSEENRERLWQALAEGEIDLIATDHSPCPPEMKSLEAGRFDEAWGGISSLQLSLPIVWTEASRRGHALSDVVRWMSEAPAKLLRLPKGKSKKPGICVGADANLVIFDPEATFMVKGEELEHRHPITPYEGRELRGVVKQTYLRGCPLLGDASHAKRKGRAI